MKSVSNVELTTLDPNEDERGVLIVVAKGQPITFMENSYLRVRWSYSRKPLPCEIR